MSVNSVCHLLLVACLALSPMASRADAPIQLIFDTDMGADCDDVGALFLLHGGVERGEVNLLATMGCTSSEFNGPCIDAINTWFGRSEIPVGTLHDPGLLPKPGYAKEISQRFPHRFPATTDYPDAVGLYREILSRQPDQSVVIVAVGPLRNIANLLRSKPDAASPLDGAELVKAKVKRLDVMGGTYPPLAKPGTAEWNFQQDASSAALVCSTWPTPILFNGEGGSTLTGRRVTYEMPEHNPLTLAYEHSASAGFAGDRFSWDPISCLVAFRGAAPWYQVVTGGTNVADPVTGVNTWKPGEGRHSYLVFDTTRPKGDVETAMEEHMIAGVPRPSGLKHNILLYAHAGMSEISSSGKIDKNGFFDLTDDSGWIQYQHADGRKYAASSYIIVCKEPGRLPGAVELAASNDGGQSWTVLDRQENPGFSRTDTRREFKIQNPEKWNIHRLNVKAPTTGAGVRIDHIELIEQINSRRDVPPSSLHLDQKNLDLTVHQRATLNASIAPAGTWKRQIKWSSSDPAVAEIRHIGEQIAVVAGKRPGRCVITANIGKLRETVEVTVTPSTLPEGWVFEELGSPPIPGAASAEDGRITLTGSGHAMTSFWERVRDQGVFMHRPVIDGGFISARLASLGPEVGGPDRYPNDRRPATAAGLMIRESTEVADSRYLLVQIEASGKLVCRWRDREGHGGEMKHLGMMTLPAHVKLERKDDLVSIFKSEDGERWGDAIFTTQVSFLKPGLAGLFVCSGNPVATATAVFDSIHHPSPRHP